MLQHQNLVNEVKYKIVRSHDRCLQAYLKTAESISVAVVYTGEYRKETQEPSADTGRDWKKHFSHHTEWSSWGRLQAMEVQSS